MFIVQFLSLELWNVIHCWGKYFLWDLSYFGMQIIQPHVFQLPIVSNDRCTVYILLIRQNCAIKIIFSGSEISILCTGIFKSLGNICIWSYTRIKSSITSKSLANSVKQLYINKVLSNLSLHFWAGSLVSKLWYCWRTDQIHILLFFLP